MFYPNLISQNLPLLKFCDVGQRGFGDSLESIETGCKVVDNFKEDMEIVFDEYLPQWNYTAVPQKC
jgi:hypothetical protein